MRLRFADGFEIGDAHENSGRPSSRGRNAHQSSSLADRRRLRCCAVCDGLRRLRRQSRRAICLQALRESSQFLFEDQLLRARCSNPARTAPASCRRWHVAGVVMFAVTGQTQKRGDDELRWTAGPRAFHRGADHFEACGQIGAIDRADLRSRSPARDRPDRRRQIGDRSAWSRRNDYWSPRRRAAPFRPRRCSSLRASRRSASRLRRSSLGQRNLSRPSSASPAVCRRRPESSRRDG